VLTVTQMLRKKGVVGKFVEFYGDGLANLTLADRRPSPTWRPEYGATCGFFPIDAETIDYLTCPAATPDRVALVEAYAKAQGMWRDAGVAEPTSPTPGTGPRRRRAVAGRPQASRRTACC
jgi:aconitate hydratase